MPSVSKKVYLVHLYKYQKYKNEKKERYKIITEGFKLGILKSNGWCSTTELNFKDNGEKTNF